MCEFQFVANTVRDLSLDFESQVLTGERKRKKTRVPYALLFSLERYYHGYIWASFFAVYSFLCTCMVYLYLFAFMDTP